MSNVILSIIVPVYNVQKYLSKNLESLIHQSCGNYEIIAVNDGSTDESLDILLEYQKKCPFLKVITQENGGISAARNKGIEEAQGDYIGFIDSDDFVSEKFVEKMIEKAQEAQSDMVVCDIEFYWNENDSRNYVMKGLNEKHKHIPDGRRGILSPLFAWNKIYRKDFFLKQNVLFQLKTWYEDLEVVTYMFAQAKTISYVDEVLIYYRQRENSIMSTRSVRCTEIFNVLKRIYNRFSEHHLLKEYYDEICYLFIENLLLYGQYRFLALDNFKELNQKSRSMMKKYFSDYQRNPYLKELSLKNRVFVQFNNSLTCSVFRKYLLRNN